MKRILFILLFLVISSPAFANHYKVIKVIDPVTFKLSNGDAVRLIGVSVPNNVEAAQNAKIFMEQLLLNGDWDIRLEFDVRRRDQRGRLLAYVYLDTHMGPWNNLRNTLWYSEGEHHFEIMTGNTYHIFLNASLIKAGYAVPETSSSNIKHAGLLRSLYQDAKENKRGLWAFYEKNANFEGDWDSVDRAEMESFYLKLEQVGDQLKGSYCAIAFYGSKVDCGFEEGVCPVWGTVKENEAEIRFKSCFGGKEGTAKLIHKGDTIEWVIKKPPVERWYFCPRKATLEKRLMIWRGMN